MRIRRRILPPVKPCVRLLTNERYITYQTEFSFRHLGHAPGVDLRGKCTWGLGGSKKIFFPEFNQIWCVSYMNGTCNSTIFGPCPLGPWGGANSKALDHPILGPKFGPIPNAKKYGFFPIPDKKFSN